jgi:adenosylcobinamide kinase/adenosylcobinamide-phosphate guanylyltransferase
MRITLLGTGSADGWPNPFCDCGSCDAERDAERSRAPSSALLDDRILVDCGPTTPHLPATAGITLQHVEHVLITHGHPDHLHPAFLLSRRWTSPRDTLHVWGPPLAIDLCRDWIGPDSAVALHAIVSGQTVELATRAGTYLVEALPAQHAHGDGDVVAEEALLFAVTAPDGDALLYATDTGPLPESTLALLDEPFDAVLLDETFGDKPDHRTGHLDLATLPGVLASLRACGAVTESTLVAATHLSHHNPPASVLRPRLAALGVRLLDDFDVIDTSAPGGGLGRRRFITGGARSGKSALAERMAEGRGPVTYVATSGDRPDDPEWTHRVAVHRARRPEHWTTVETIDVAGVLASAAPGSVVLVDCLALWLTAHLDALDAWQRSEEGDGERVRADAAAPMTALVTALEACPADVVLVSNEVGMGVVPATASGRLFRDLLGALNVQVAAACDESTLAVAGIAVPLTRTRGARRHAR